LAGPPPTGRQQPARPGHTVATHPRPGLVATGRVRDTEQGVHPAARTLAGARITP